MLCAVNIDFRMPLDVHTRIEFFFKSKDQLLFILLLRFYVGKTFLEFTLNRHVICSISQQAYNGKRSKENKKNWIENKILQEKFA